MMFVLELGGLALLIFALSHFIQWVQDCSASREHPRGAITSRMGNISALVEWLEQVQHLPRPQRGYTIGNWVDDHGERPADQGRYIEFVTSQFGTFERYEGISYNLGGTQSFVLAPRDNRLSFLLSLDVGNSSSSAKFRNFSVKYFNFGRNSEAVLFELINLRIDVLSIDNHAGSFHLHNCFIGTLRLNSGATKDFDVRGGAILDIQCPPPTAEGPFTGSVHFDHDTWLPRKPGTRLAGPQPYRNLREHMRKLENAPMVSRFHSLEQAVERGSYGLIDKGLSHTYALLSDYGSSTLRPMLWLLFLFVLTSVIIFWFDGAVLSNTLKSEGWHAGLSGADLGAEVSRAVTLTMSATVNPLGIFTTTGLLFGRNGWITTWLLIHGLLSLVCIVLLIFALRRRFKIS